MIVFGQWLTRQSNREEAEFPLWLIGARIDMPRNWRVAGTGKDPLYFLHQERKVEENLWIASSIWMRLLANARDWKQKSLSLRALI